jgi:glutamyl-tRNA synthetase
MIRTRFAPSPTGFQHLGGFRTGLYAWAFARHNQGQFVLRIEDTDQERKVDGAISYILESFNWLGIDIDEGPSFAELKLVGENLGAEFEKQNSDLGGKYAPYIQSLRMSRYQEIAKQLLKSGHAYCSTLSGPELDQAILNGTADQEKVPDGQPCAIRLKLPKNFNISFEDGARGTISWSNPPLKDPAILKSDGLPTYHLASIVDDHDMEITHVMRGDEWLATTPIHLYLYDILNWKRPIFCHLAPILGKDGKKLSKRHGASSLNEYREQGYLPEALLNFVALIGWSPGNDQEIFSIQEIANLFSLSGLSCSGGVFDEQKLLWMNAEHIKKLSDADLTNRLQNYLATKDKIILADHLRILLPNIRERIKKLSDVEPLIEFLTSKLSFDLDILVKKKISNELALQIVTKAKTIIQSLNDYSVSNLENNLKTLTDELQIKIPELFVTLRVASTGTMTALPLFDCMVALGKEEVLKRFDLFEKRLATQ